MRGILDQIGCKLGAMVAFDTPEVEEIELALRQLLTLYKEMPEDRARINLLGKVAAHLDKYIRELNPDYEPAMARFTKEANANDKPD